MPQFVKQTLGDLEASDKEDLKKVIMAVSAEALLPYQAKLDRRDANAIEDGRKLLTDPQSPFGCTNCHSFHDKGTPGDMPILTGYGSAAWIAGIIRDPTDKQYYGRLNDRMPSFAGTANRFTSQHAPSATGAAVSDWIRGDWWGAGRLMSDQ